MTTQQRIDRNEQIMREKFPGATLKTTSREVPGLHRDEPDVLDYEIETTAYDGSGMYLGSRFEEV